MPKAIWSLIRETLKSKKFVLMIAGTLTAALMKIGLNLPTEDVAAVLTPLIAYLLAQGWADNGKEAAKINAVAAQAEVSGPARQAMVEISDSVKAKQ